VRPIGEGGFGTVWLANQEEPIRRRVALKIIKLGMDTRQVVARFEAERQALALMDHSNIAKVLDGGTTASGRPYFVMELVEGPRITDYCESRTLGVEGRLRLFLMVCHAVHHAHQKGVIHRDLKPSNVLVAQEDGRPVPKVIDFGIAKATGEPLTGATVLTRMDQILGTPAYMSPEQAGLGAQDIDTRSDVYSLGVLLYELLTGAPPFEPGQFMRAGWEAALRLIREVEPPRPSERLASRTAAQQRSPTTRGTARSLARDLDWIVMRCLEKDRNRRYDSASGLAEDVERFLRHEPVTAAAPSLRYQAAKFARRHRVVLATVTAFLAVLIAGTAASLWQAMRARGYARAEYRERQRAEANLRQAQEAVQKYLLEVANDPRLKRGDLTALRRQLLARATPFYESFIAQQGAEPTLLLEQAALWRELGQIDRIDGRDADAIAAQELARKLLNALPPDLPESGRRARALSGVLDELGLLKGAVGRHEEAIRDLEAAVALSRELRARQPGDPTHGLELAAHLGNLGLALRRDGRAGAAEVATREGLDLVRELGLRRGTNAAYQANMVAGLISLADDVARLGRAHEVEPLLREAVALGEQAERGGDGSRFARETLGLALEAHGAFLERNLRLGEAMARYRRAAFVQQKLAEEHASSPGHQRTAIRALRAAAQLSARLSPTPFQYDEACTLLDSARALGTSLLQGATQPGDRTVQVEVLWELSGYRAQRGDHEAAMRLAVDLGLTDPRNPASWRRAAQRIAGLVGLAEQDPRFAPAERAKRATTFLQESEYSLRRAIAAGHRALDRDLADASLQRVLSDPVRAADLAAAAEYFDGPVRGAPVFTEPFAGTLSAAWQVRHEEPADYSLSKLPGSVLVRARPGDFFGPGRNDVNTFLWRQLGLTNAGLEVRVRVSGFDLRTPALRAGVCWFEDEDNFIYLGVNAADRANPRGFVALVREANGSSMTISYPPLPQMDPIWLRITQWKNQCAFDASIDGREWLHLQVLSWRAALPTSVGLTANTRAPLTGRLPEVGFGGFEVRPLSSPPARAAAGPGAAPGP
jgi:tetratricopeptide (TPR) repeat protein